MKLPCSLLTTVESKSQGFSQPPHSFIFAVTGVLSCHVSRARLTNDSGNGGLSSDGIMIQKLCVWNRISSVLSQSLCWY